MYCSICGEACVIPEGYEGNTLGAIINKETSDVKVIRCVECVNERGIDSLTFVCSKQEGRIVEPEYLLITIGKRYWFTSLHFARRGLFDFSSGRSIIHELCKANEWQVSIQVVDEKALKICKSTHEKIDI